MNKEQWKSVGTHQGLYEVSNRGRVRSLPRPRVRGGIKNQYDNDNGYMYVGLWKNNKRKGIRVHRLVLETFIGSCPNKMIACHKDGNKKNNAAKNLEWNTNSNNQLARRAHGTQQQTRGKKHSRLSKFDVLVIKLCYFAGMPCTKIHKHFVNFSYVTICNVASGRTHALV